MRVPTRRAEKFIKRESGPYLITADALARLEASLARLERDMPNLIHEVERTKEHGDFSENAAYQDAKHTLRRAHARVASIKDRLKRAVVIKQGPNTTGKVEIGSTVVLETGKKQVTFEILGSHEADPGHGRISESSPLGQALLNHGVGDEITLPIKSGEVRYRIVEIR